MYGRLVSMKGFERTTAPTTIVVTNMPAPGGKERREGEKETKVRYTHILVNTPKIKA